MRIILGSKSIGRQAVMKEAGYNFDIITADINEKAIRFDDPKKLALALAHAKADAILPKIKGPALLITSDQVVLCNGMIREKPRSEDEAREFIRCYRGHPMETVTSIVITNTETKRRAEGIDIAKVYFGEISEEAINEAIRNGRVMHCAGAMRCEEPPLSHYVKRFEGTKDSTSGLPLKLLYRLIEEVKIKKCHGE